TTEAMDKILPRSVLLRIGVVGCSSLSTPAMNEQWRPQRRPLPCFWPALRNATPIRERSPTPPRNSQHSIKVQRLTAGRGHRTVAPQPITPVLVNAAPPSHGAWGLPSEVAGLLAARSPLPEHL